MNFEWLENSSELLDGKEDIPVHKARVRSGVSECGDGSVLPGGRIYSYSTTPKRALKYLVAGGEMKLVVKNPWGQALLRNIFLNVAPCCWRADTLLILLGR